MVDSSFFLSMYGEIESYTVTVVIFLTVPCETRIILDDIFINKVISEISDKVLNRYLQRKTGLMT